MTDLEHDITPVVKPPPRGHAAGRVGTSTGHRFGDAFAGELDARPEQREPKGWAEHFKKQVG